MANDYDIGGGELLDWDDLEPSDIGEPADVTYNFVNGRRYPTWTGDGESQTILVRMSEVAWSDHVEAQRLLDNASAVAPVIRI